MPSKYYPFTYTFYGPLVLINNPIVALIAYSHFTYFVYTFVTLFYQAKLDYT